MMVSMRKKNQYSLKRLALPVIVMILLGTGCRSIGPKKVTHDRFDYSRALADSWKKQMLLNIVKVRYLDLPIFLDVGQLVSGYSFETSMNVGGSITPSGGLGSVGAQGKYTDRPTITYMPLTGEQFLEGFLTPIQPLNVFSLIQSGYEADFVLELCLDSFNGLFNRSASLDSKRQPNPQFFKVITLLRQIQDAGGIGMRLKESSEGRPAFVVFFRNENVSEEILEKSSEVRRLLQVPLDEMEFELVYSPLRGEAGELSVGSRSLLQILMALSLGVNLPQSHLERKLVPPLGESSEEESALLRVYSGQNKPNDCFVAVPYEGEWFWIANHDWKSKNTFSSILFLFTLTGKSEARNLPTITIPTY